MPSAVLFLVPQPGCDAMAESIEQNINALYLFFILCLSEGIIVHTTPYHGS